MKQPNLLKQRGTVLAFSLVMLLLLTLVGVSMIQQNKQELSMAGNARQQTQALATAESELSIAEAAIDDIRFGLNNVAAKNANQCNSTQLHEDTVLRVTETATETVTSTVKEVYCLWDYIEDKGWTEQRCSYNNGERDLGNPPPPNNACARLNLAGTGKNLEGCPTELYTLHTTFTDSKGTERTVESKYAVNCSGNSG